MWVYFLPALFSSLAFSLIIPEIPRLFYSFHFPLVNPKQSLALLFSSYALANFFGASLLGALSDRWGRKFVLLLGMAGVTLGYFCSGYAVYQKSYSLLLLGEILAGITSIHIPLIYAVVADRFDHREKRKQMGVIVLTLGFGYLLGPLCNGLLIQQSLSGSLFFIASLFQLGGLLTLLFCFQDRKFLSQKEKKISPYYAFASLKNVRKYSSLYFTWSVTFLMTLAWQAMMKFLQVALVERFSFSHRSVCLAYVAYGMGIIFSHFAIYPLFITRFSTIRGLKWVSSLLSLALCLFFFSFNRWLLFTLLFSFALGESCFRPYLADFVSEQSTRENYGEIFGIFHSLQSLVKIIAPQLSSFFSSRYSGSELLFSAVLMLIAALSFRFQEKRQLSHLSL